MRPYQQMPIGSHPAAGLQQRVQCNNIYFLFTKPQFTKPRPQFSKSDIGKKRYRN
jgi:hypothetical protein